MAWNSRPLFQERRWTQDEIDEARRRGWASRGLEPPGLETDDPRIYYWFCPCGFQDARNVRPSTIAARASFHCPKCARAMPAIKAR